MSRNENKPRIVIYGTGVCGCAFLRLAVRKGLPIVAAYNRAGNKVGQDLGKISGLDRELGVIVQDCDTASYDNLDADIAVVVTNDWLEINWPAYQRLMGAGLNVICHGVQSYYPQVLNPDFADKIGQLARENDVTFTGTGVWDMSRIWSCLIAAGACADIKSLSHKSVTNCNYSRADVIDFIGAGYSQEKFISTFADASTQVNGMYKAVLLLVLNKLGFTVTDIVELVEPVIYNMPVNCLALERELDAGEIVGTRFVWEVQTKEGVRASAKMEWRLLRDGEKEYMAWDIEGVPRSIITVERKDTVLTTAACMLNRIPDVIAAPSGIQLISNLGPMKPW